MNLLDIFLVLALLLFIWKGFRTGLVGAIGGFFGVIFGIWAASHNMQQAGEWVMRVANFDNAALANILGFIAIFLAVNIAFGIIISVINRVFHIIPFIDFINKLMGAIVGLIGGVLALSAFVYMLSLFSISDTIANVLLGSQFAHWAMDVVVLVKPFIPDAIDQMQSIL